MESLNIILRPGLLSWGCRINGIKHRSGSDKVRGNARRCNLNNELNMLKTIFNWYKDEEKFKNESNFVQCPIKKHHKKKGIIRPLPVKNRQISIDHVFLFTAKLEPIYRDHALLQYYTASRIIEVAGLQWKRIDFKNKE